MGAQLGNLEWAHLPGTLRVGGKGLWRWSVSLCEHSLAGDPEGYIEKALEMGNSFHRSPIWGTWRRAHLLGNLRAGEEGSGDEASLSEDALCRGPWAELLHWGLCKIC